MIGGGQATCSGSSSLIGCHDNTWLLYARGAVIGHPLRFPGQIENFVVVKEKF